MTVVQINISCKTGSTGKICAAVSKLLSERQIVNYILCSSDSTSNASCIRYMNKFEIKLQALKSRIFGNYGFNSKSATKRLIKHLEQNKPDVVHLHNIHGHNVHLGVLFEYFSRKNIKLFWTFHDCWAYTAYCPYYDMVGCDKWKNGGCARCPQKRRFSWFFDRSQKLFYRKKQLFSNLDLTIITPSEWLANEVRESFFANYDVKVINNGIDLSIFKPSPSDFRKSYNLDGKFILLGVAFGWGRRKGLDVFVRLAEKLDPERFQIVLVGTDKNIDKSLPANIVSIHRTANQQQLAEIYTAADLFVNPTREENFPTVNIEAIACGTPVLTYRTGGSPEIINSKTGAVVDCDDEESLLREIIRIESEKPFDSIDCVKSASVFSSELKYLQYLQVYGVHE